MTLSPFKGEPRGFLRTPEDVGTGPGDTEAIALRMPSFDEKRLKSSLATALQARPMASMGGYKKRAVNIGVKVMFWHRFRAPKKGVWGSHWADMMVYMILFRKGVGTYWAGSEFILEPMV